MFLLFTLATGWGFIGAGLVAYGRRPDSRLGALMVGVGFAWFLTSLTALESSLAYTIGRALTDTLWGGVLLHMVMAFPTGRLPDRPSRIVVAAGYLALAGLQAAPRLFADDPPRRCPWEECPTNLLLVVPNSGLARALSLLQWVLVAGVVVTAIILLVTRWRRASPTERRALEPVFYSGGATGILGALLLAARPGEMNAVEKALEWATLVAIATVPFAFLGGLLRSQLSRSGAVGLFMRQLRELPGPVQLRDGLARALGDPRLALAYWLPQTERFVDADGRPVELPHENSGRTVTFVGEGKPDRIAAIIHDAALRDDLDSVRTVGEAAALWLDRERLEAQLRARVTDLRKSRARLVEAGDAERRRIERDLHDGAQQRLASLLLELKLERRAIDGDQAAMAALLDELEGGLAAALGELRALAAGILPPVLTDRGLGAAVQELASRTPLALEVETVPCERLPDPVEVAGYFVVAEALANVVKHARAKRVAIRVAHDSGRLIVEVRDDGHGGADPESGSGLRGLADRVGALDGRLSCQSLAGRGTTLRAEIPCGTRDTSQRPRGVTPPV